MELRKLVLLLYVLARCSSKVVLPHRAARLDHRAARLDQQSAGEQFTWRYPEDPVEQLKKPPLRYKVRRPKAPGQVVVRCGESRVHVEVDQDLLGIGTKLNPEEVSLGGCPVKEVDDSVLIFESELHGCGSTLEVRQRGIVYAFQILYQPRSLGPIVRSQSANIKVECHYNS